MISTTITPKKLLKDAEANPVINWACRVNEIEMRYKTRTRTPKDSIQIGGSEQAADIIREHFSDLLADTIEYFSVLYLNRNNKVIGFQVLSMGGITGTVADPRIVLKAAILVDACGIILAHNHPSGNPKPSTADKDLTQKIRVSAALMDIKVTDHIILTADGYTSFADEGII